jgi:DMSO reductase family type II enzyme chaperone
MFEIPNPKQTQNPKSHVPNVGGWHIPARVPRRASRRLEFGPWDLGFEIWDLVAAGVEESTVASVALAARQDEVMNHVDSVDRHCPESTPAVAGERSLARGVIYRFVAAAYRYPEPVTAGAVCEQLSTIPEALAALDDSADSRLGSRVDELRIAAESSDFEERLERDYVSLFGHVVRGCCPLYETEYGDSQQQLLQPHELSDLAAFYRAFGLKLALPVHERVDFLSVECEFMAFLCVKQAYAEEQGDEALAGIAVDAQRKFLRDHLGRWLPACARQTIAQAGDGFYGRLARLTLAYVAEDCRRLGVEPGQEHLKLRLPLAPAEACLSCPMAEGEAVASS